METLHNIIDNLQDFLWTYINIGLLIGCAIYFTVRTRFIQFRLLGDMVRQMFSSGKSAGSHGGDGQAEKGKKPISSFQAFIVALASRIGTGNLAGVATAISVGGPGAIFWMWVMALFGAATAFVESTLAQLYKRKGKGSYHGGPAYYMRHGLHRKWMGILFSILIIITFGFANNAMQSNTIALACEQAFNIPLTVMGVLLSALTVAIIFGGIHRIARVSSALVPVMAVAYLVIAVWVVITHISIIPDIMRMIVSEAFGAGQFAGGTLGTVVMIGVKRGLFSNEAGEGSAPNAAAIAHTSHPVKQGLLQALGVFADTLVVCSCTAFIILLSGIYDSGRDGIILTKYALETHIGEPGGLFITLAIFLFAYSTIIANYFYGETNIRFITSKKRYIQLFRIITGMTVMAGSLMTLQEAWIFVDLAMGVMTLVNLAAILQLSPQVMSLLHNYLTQRKQGLDPVFHRRMMPEVEKDIECWE